MNAPKQAGLPPLPLKDSELFRDQCYVDGAWIGADSCRTFAVNNPASGEALGSVPDLGRPKPGAPSRRRKKPGPRGARKPARSAPPSCVSGTT